MSFLTPIAMLHDDVSATDLDLPFSASAVMVGCLPPFKSLFKGRGSFHRYNSPVNGKNPSPDLQLDVIHFGRARASGKAKARPKVMSRPVNGDGKENVFDGGFGAGYHVPHGAIGVRSDYVSFCDFRLGRGESRWLIEFSSLL